MPWICRICNAGGSNSQSFCLQCGGPRRRDRQSIDDMVLIRCAKPPGRQYEFLQLPKAVYHADRYPQVGLSVLRFFKDSQLKNYELEHWTDGLLRRRVGGRLASTAGMCSHQKSGFAAFVISTTGAFYIFNHRDKVDRIAHSTFGGFAVRAAGEIQIIKGKITVVTNHTGHYRPTLIQTAAMLYWFDQYGMLRANTLVSLIRSLKRRELELLGPSKVRRLSCKKELAEDELEFLRDTKSQIDMLRKRIATLMTAPVAVSSTDLGPEIRKKIEELNKITSMTLSADAIAQLTGYDLSEVKKAMTDQSATASREELALARDKEIKRLRFQIRDQEQVIQDTSREIILSNIYPAMIFSRTIIYLTRDFEQVAS